MASNKPILILIRGLPGSGKSYLATALQKSLGKDKVVVLDPDATDYTSKTYADFSAALSAEGVDLKFHPYRFLRSQAYAAISARKVIVWNQAFTNLDGFNKTVVNLQAYASEHGTQLPVLVVEVEINHDTAKERVAQREQQGGHGVSEDAFARFINAYESFADKGYATIAVRGDDAVSISVSSVMDTAKELLEK